MCIHSFGHAIHALEAYLSLHFFEVICTLQVSVFF